MSGGDVGATKLRTAVLQFHPESTFENQIRNVGIHRQIRTMGAGPDQSANLNAVDSDVIRSASHRYIRDVRSRVRFQ